MVDELIGSEVVVYGIGFKHPLEVIEMRSVVMVTDPSCLHQQSLYVVVL